MTHAVNDFCVVELSNFYLDIIKDRLYCEGTDGLARRSAQTALYLILDTMTKLMAPILAFTCDEIWQAMPHRAGDDGRNVVFNEMNQPFADYALSADADGPVGQDHRRARRGQRRPGNRSRREEDRQEPGGRHRPDRPRRGCVPGRDARRSAGRPAHRLPGGGHRGRRHPGIRQDRRGRQVPALLEGPAQP